ncbi:hypothetical protein [Salmonella phage ZCSE7]|nr:hypothetical protein [Salmonella phage ZCSE7]
MRKYQVSVANKLRFTVDGQGLPAKINGLVITESVIAVDKNAINGGIRQLL